MTKISLCMIVKDEEFLLSKCLESVNNLVDEIILVDTGSSDHTIHIGKAFQAKVFEYDWKLHFAEARNYSLSLASGDWILWLDADEWLDKNAVAIIKEAIEDYDTDVFTLPVINYYGSIDPLEEKNAFTYKQPRLFRHHKGIQFKNSIHETIYHQNRVIKSIEAPIHHIGYTDEITAEKRKSERNLSFIHEALKTDEEDPWLTYHLASEYYRLKRFETAFHLLNRSIILFLFENKKPPALLYRLKYAILFETGSMDGLLPGIDKAIELYPDYVDLHYLRGLLLMEKKMYKAAIQAFKHCLILGETNSDYIVQRGVGSFLAERYIVICANEIGNDTENVQ